MVGQEPWTFFPANTAPKALDIVWCLFPFVEQPGVPGPKSRPGLVKQVLRKDDRAYVEVAYGTSRFDRYSQGDLIIANSTDLVEMGLPQATVFLLGRTVTLPWAKEWFGPLDGHGPAFSRLNNKYREYLGIIQKRLPKK